MALLFVWTSLLTSTGLVDQSLYRFHEKRSTIKKWLWTAHFLLLQSAKNQDNFKERRNKAN